MNISLFHIYRNTPLGRENLLQSAYLCDRLGSTTLHLYCPSATQAIIYFSHGPVTVTLDGSYIHGKETARAEARDILSGTGVKYDYFEPKDFTADTIVDLPAEWSMMACPRVISESSGRIGLGRLGPKVRAIVKAAPFPVFIPCGAYKPWTSVTAFFGGSAVGLRAVEVGVDIAERTGMPLTVVTQVVDPAHGDRCRQALADAEVLDKIEHTEDWSWQRFETGTLEDNLMRVAHDSLVVVGAAGDSLIRELIFGSKLELIQTTLPNPIVVVGPNCDRRLVW
jgi:nucleotide-binding universal stress UspA family protein